MRRGSNTGTQEAAVDPQASSVVLNGGPTTAVDMAVEDPTLPSTAVNKHLISSYGENCWVYNCPPGTTTLQGRATSKNWRKIEAATHPNDTPLFGDCMWRGAGPDLTGQDGEAPAFNGEWSGSGYESKHFTMIRHGKGIEMLMFDGSVRPVRPRQLWRLYWHKSYDITYGDRNASTVFKPWMP
jgi:prepilin-type processing-associated H-X9-DG protein